jgi:hypothetical protein
MCDDSAQATSTEILKGWTFEKLGQGVVPKFSRGRLSLQEGWANLISFFRQPTKVHSPSQSTVNDTIHKLMVGSDEMFANEEAV